MKTKETALWSVVIAIVFMVMLTTTLVWLSPSRAAGTFVAGWTARVADVVEE